MTIAWTTVQEAIHDWVLPASSLAAGKVLWNQQAAPVPSGTWIGLRVTSIRPFGQDWVSAVELGTPLAPDADGIGRELEMKARGQRRAVLSIQCYAGAAQGNSSPAAILERIVLSAKLPSVRHALNVAGIGIGTIEPIQSVDGIVNVETFEPRGIVIVHLNLASEISEYSTYIGSVEVENETTSSTIVIDGEP